MNFLNSFSARLYDLPYLFAVFLVTFTLHEVSHALVGTWLGDHTPRMEGRLSLNPMRHLDIQGFLLMLLIGIGWTKPVPLEESNYRTNNDYTLAVLAGPIMNLISAVLGILSFPLLAWGMSVLISQLPSPNLAIQFWGILTHFLNLFVQINVFFLIFNLLPLPNLDGFNLWRSLLGSPDWFFEFFLDPFVSLGIFIAIVSGFIPIGSWAYLITRGLISIVMNFLSLF